MISAFLNARFDLKRHHTSVRKELLAGLTTFATMAYVIVVNPLILSDAGMNFSSVMLATILICIIGTLCMAFIANYPFAIAPGIAMAAYFSYSVVLGQNISWQVALGTVFWTGILLLVLWAFRLRELIIAAIPKGLQLGTAAGIGLFLVLVGLQNAHIVVSNPKTLVALGNLAAPEAMLTGLGIVVIAALMALNIQGAILIAILLNWSLGFFFGLTEWKGIIAWPQFDMATFGALDWREALSFDLWIVTFSFLFICLFDVAGALMGLSHYGQFLDKEGKLHRLRRALLPDAIATTIGAACGTSATTIYLESASGITAGGRTGLTIVVVGLLFLLMLFFEPLASSIPLFAITPALITIGAMMLRSVIHLNWEDTSDLIPAFVTLIGIPLSYNIGTGIGMGMVLYPLCKIGAGKWREVHPLAWLLAAIFFLKFALD